MHNLSALAPVRAGQSRGRSIAAVGAALLLAALAQTSAAVYLPPVVPHPDLVLLVALAWGFLRGRGEGFVAGIAGGLLLDLCSSTPFGLHVLALGLATLLVDAAGATLADGIVRRSVGGVVAAAIVHVLAIGAIQLHGWELWSPATAMRSVLPALAADALILPGCYALLRRLPEPEGDDLMGGA